MGSAKGIGFARIEFTLTNGQIISIENPAITSARFTQNFKYEEVADPPGGFRVRRDTDSVECEMVFDATDMYWAMQPDAPLELDAPLLALDEPEVHV